MALKRRLGLGTIIDNLKAGFNRVYRAKGFTKFDFDLSGILEDLAGDKAVYAFSHAIGLPSSTSLRRHGGRPRVAPSAGPPHVLEVRRNIRTFFQVPPPEPNDAATPRCGHSLAIDGIALARRVRHHKPSDSMVGLAREDTAGVDLTMSSFDVVRDVAEAVHGPEPTIRYAKEATVAVVAPFRDDDYHPLPVMLSGTAKVERAAEFTDVLQMIIDEWVETGEPLVGPVWLFTSDRDPVFRNASYTVFLDRVLQPSSALYKLLAPLEGMNLATGPYDMIWGPDPKHLVKSACC